MLHILLARLIKNDYSGYKNINYENQKETEFTNNYSRTTVD